MGEKRESWLMGVVVASKAGTCLVNALTSPGPLRVRQLCRMLPSLHSLAAGVASPTSHLDLATCSAALCESRAGYIVAALTTKTSNSGADDRDRRESAMRVAETVSRAFERHGGDDLDAFIARDVENAETRAHDAGDDETTDDAECVPSTHPSFRRFHETYLDPIVIDAHSRPAHQRWLEPLVGCAAARVAHAHVLIARSEESTRTGAGEHDDLSNARVDDQDFNDPTSSDELRRRELARPRSIRMSIVASARGVEASHPLARLCEPDAMGSGEVWREVTRRCLAMTKNRAARSANGNGEVIGSSPGKADKVRGVFAAREARAPPETAVLVFRDARARSRDAGDGVGREGESRTLRAVIHAFSCHPGSALGTACAVAFCVSPSGASLPGGASSPGGASPGGRDGRGWPDDEIHVSGPHARDFEDGGVGLSSRYVVGGTGATSSVMPTDLARALYRVSDAVRADADPPFDWPRVTLSKNIDDTAGAAELSAGVDLASLRGTFRGNRVAPEGGRGGEGAKGAAPPSGRGVRRVVPA